MLSKVRRETARSLFGLNRLNLEQSELEPNVQPTNHNVQMGTNMRLGRIGDNIMIESLQVRIGV